MRERKTDPLYRLVIGTALALFLVLAYFLIREALNRRVVPPGFGPAPSASESKQPEEAVSELPRLKPYKKGVPTQKPRRKTAAPPPPLP